MTDFQKYGPHAVGLPPGEGILTVFGGIIHVILVEIILIGGERIIFARIIGVGKATVVR